MARQRRGTQFDPHVVDVFISQAERLLAGLDEADGASTKIVPDGNRWNGTGIRSARTHVDAVCGCTPLARAHPASFTR